MKVKMLLPALTEATSPFFRPIKYSLFPPLGLATLAGYLQEDDEVEIQDEHVETLDLDDEPDVVVIQVYITSANRAYRIADHYRRKGAHVALGGLHVTSLPEEAAQHADTICLGPGEDIWPAFLADLRRGGQQRVYRSATRTLDGLPLGFDRARRLGARDAVRHASPRRVCGRVEEVRAALGPRDPRAPGGDDAPGTRGDPRRVRQAPGVAGFVVR